MHMLCHMIDPIGLSQKRSRLTKDVVSVTHTAGAYTLLDPTSPIFMRDDTIFAPTYVVCLFVPLVLANV